MKYAIQFPKLCTPAFLYFVISAFIYILVILQNVNNNRVFYLGYLSCNVPSTWLILVIKAMYIIFWTWILNLMCKDGYPTIAWIFVFFPFLLIMLFIAKGKERYTSPPIRRDDRQDARQDTIIADETYIQNQIIKKKYKEEEKKKLKHSEKKQLKEFKKIFKGE